MWKIEDSIPFHQFEHDSGNPLYIRRCSLILLFVFPSEIDNEGVIEPDNDDPQEMGDENVEVNMVFSMSVGVGKIGKGFEFRQG